MNLLGYIRVSSEDQATGGHSLTLVQPERLRTWCAANGHTLVDVVVDGEGEGEAFRGVSGGMPLAKRKGGAELLTRLRAGEADGVVVVSLTRLFRDVDDGRFFLRKVWRKAGVRLFSLGEPIDVTTAAGRFVLNQLLVAAEYERELTAERTAHTAQALRRAGKVYGNVPYGCVAVDGRLFRHPVAWQTRERIVSLRASGMTLRAIADELRRTHVPAPAGGPRWAPSSIDQLVASHDSLTHLPVAEQPARNPAPAPDAAASQGTPRDERL